MDEWQKAREKLKDRKTIRGREINGDMEKERKAWRERHKERNENRERETDNSKTGVKLTFKNGKTILKQVLKCHSAKCHETNCRETKCQPNHGL